MDLQFVTQFMMQNFEQCTIKNNGTHFLARCLLCGDSAVNPYKKRFNLNWNNGVPGWHCWNCDRHGNFITLYSVIKGISYDDAKLELYKFNKKEAKRRLKEYKNRPIKKENKIIEEDNFDFMLDKFYEYDKNYEYAGILEKKYIQVLKKFYDDRKISDKYKLYICHSGKYKNRIIIPIFNEKGNIIYFQARRIPKSGIDPKYDNPVAPKELCILNKHKFDIEKNIIVFEGLIDAYMVGNQGTSCLGKVISEDLITNLLKLTNRNVIIALDNDFEAYKALDNFFKKNKYAKKIKYFLYPKQFEGHKDINSYVVNKKEEIDVYKLITQNSVDYSTAYIKLSISKLLGGNINENNSNRK